MTWFAAQLYLHDSLLTQYTVSTKHSNFTLECHCLETAQSELILITWSYKLIRTSTILIAQVWKPPNISKTHCIPNTREHEIELLSPFLTIVLDFHFFRAIFNGHLFDKSSAAVFWSSRFLVRDNNAIDLCLWHVLRWTLIDRFVGLCCAWGKAIKCTLEIRDLPLYQILIIRRPDHEPSLELQVSHTNFTHACKCRNRHSNRRVHILGSFNSSTGQCQLRLKTIVTMQMKRDNDSPIVF